MTVSYFITLTVSLSKIASYVFMYMFQILRTSACNIKARRGEFIPAMNESSPHENIVLR